MELLHPVKIGAIVEEKRRYVRVTLLARDVQYIRPYRAGLQ